MLEQLSSAVEEQLLAGMTTATDATRQILSVALQEAARCRLLRLGSTLRSLGEELTRYSSQDTLFSRRRLTFFLNRAWLLSRGLAHALKQDDVAEYDRLNWSPTAQPIAEVTLSASDRENASRRERLWRSIFGSARSPLPRP